jgi:gluconolactonase
MKRTLALVLVALGSVLPLRAEDNPVVEEGAKPEKLWGEGTFTEGPAYGPDHCVYFSDIGNRVMKFDPASKRTTVFREPSGKANGLDFDPRGRLVACEGAAGGNRRVTRTEKDGKVSVLADRWMGKRFNSPNDLTIDSKGRVYFTDPRYGGDEKREIDTESVYRIDPDNLAVTQVITDVEKPNGVLLSPDGKTLYVADSNPRGKRQLLSFPLKEDGVVGPKKVLHDFGEDRGIDGMCVDVKGNIYGAAGRGKTGGVHVFTPEGKKLAFLPTPETPTNCVFGGKDRRDLYITAGKSLYRVRVKTEGFAVYWPPKE